MTNIIYLNGENIQSKEDLHLELKNSLKLPDYYGGNLDALWDCLTGWVDRPLIITWRHFNKSKGVLEQYADKVVETFREADAEVGGITINLEE